MNVDEQLDITKRVLSMLNNRVHKDETTDPTGYTITKRKMQLHMEAVTRDVENGILKPNPRKHDISFE